MRGSDYWEDSDSDEVIKAIAIFEVGK